MGGGKPIRVQCLVMERLVAVWNEVIRRLDGLIIRCDDGEAVRVGRFCSTVADAAAPMREAATVVEDADFFASF